MFTILAVALVGLAQDPSNPLNIEFVVLDRNGVARPYEVTDIHSPSPPPGRDRNYASRFRGLKGTGLPDAPFRVTLSPLSRDQSDTIRGIKCFDSEVWADFSSGGRGNALVVVSSNVNCPSMVDWDESSRTPWIIRNSPTGVLRARVVHAIDRGGHAIYDAWVVNGKFGLRPLKLGPYIITLLRGNEVVGHADIAYKPNHLYPQGVVELDWATRKQIR